MTSPAVKMPSITTDKDGGHNDTIANLISELQGQVDHVPDMLARFSSWPQGGRNKYYGRLKAKLDEIARG